MVIQSHAWTKRSPGHCLEIDISKRYSTYNRTNKRSNEWANRQNTMASFACISSKAPIWVHTQDLGVLIKKTHSSKVSTCACIFHATSIYNLKNPFLGPFKPDSHLWVPSNFYFFSFFLSPSLSSLHLHLHRTFAQMPGRLATPRIASFQPTGREHCAADYFCNTPKFTKLN